MTRVSMVKSTGKVMLVDDDLTIIDTLRYNLTAQGFVSVEFSSALDALSKMDELAPDLVVLDWMMPDLSGPDMCRLMRERQIEVPVLMLTGRGRPEDVAHGLAAGADDYLTKPFSVIEFLARVRALLRRASALSRSRCSLNKLEVGDLVLDESAKRVHRQGRELHLSPKLFLLLKVLMENAGKVMSVETLLDRVWGVDYAGDAKTVAVHIRWLRKNLEVDPRNPRLVETVHGFGYRLNSP